MWQTETGAKRAFPEPAAQLALSWTPLCSTVKPKVNLWCHLFIRSVVTYIWDRMARHLWCTSVKKTQRLIPAAQNNPHTMLGAVSRSNFCSYHCATGSLSLLLDRWLTQKFCWHHYCLHPALSRARASPPWALVCLKMEACTYLTMRVVQKIFLKGSWASD